MEKPLKRRDVTSEAVGDGLSVFDHEQKQTYLLNATSALVFQHCDGQTTREELAEILRRKLNVQPAEAGQLVRLALAELETAGLLEADAAATPPLAGAYSRREAFTSFATLGLSLALMPIIARVAEAQGGHSLIPLLECVDNNGDGTYTAHFGYLNQTNAPIQLPIGPKNMFVPGQQDFGQPTVFQPGEQLNVFSVVFNAGDELKWMLKADGDKRHQVTASAASEICTTTGFPMTTTGFPFTTTVIPMTTTTPFP
jgi:PqqD family protein of HPr-rel-A system